jgi:hypothetical protein
VQSVAHNEPKKVLRPLAAREHVAGKYRVQVMMHQIDLFRAEYLRLPGWICCQHIALTILLTHNYTIHRFLRRMAPTNGVRET